MFNAAGWSSILQEDRKLLGEGEGEMVYVHTIYLSINIESIFRFHIPLTFFLSSFFIQSIINTKYSLNIINETGNLLHEKTTFMGIPG